MKIAFITHYKSLYGANRSLLNLIEGLRKYNVTSYVISPDNGEITDVMRNRNIQFLIQPIQKWMSEYASPHTFTNYIQWRYYALKRLGINIRTLFPLKRQLQKWDVDIVYSNSAVIPIGAFVARCLNLPHVWHLREFGDLDYGLRHDWGRYLFIRFIASADVIIAISKAVKIHHLGSIANNRTHIIYNGIAWESDYDKFYDYAHMKQTDPNHFKFALVGLIHRNKGQEIAIKAMSIIAKKYPSVRLIIVGGGKIDKLKRFAKELGIYNNIKFSGYIANPYDIYKKVDAILMCSKYEAMGRVTVEAMSSCLPVIGYDNAGTSEIIQHEKTGLLYSGGAENLASCMKLFIEQPEWAQRLGEKGWEIARSRYTIECYSKKIYEVLQSIKN
jgi:glycosyltransferase involved in cell wall biosynthesis